MTAETAAPSDLPTALKHLAIAGRSLGSCHTELRNCLWDLRHRTLENLNLDDAISQTVIRDHTSIILEKLGVTNRVEAVAIALRKHLLKI